MFSRIAAHRYEDAHDTRVQFVIAVIGPWSWPRRSASLHLYAARADGIDVSPYSSCVARFPGRRSIPLVEARKNFAFLASARPSVRSGASAPTFSVGIGSFR